MPGSEWSQGHDQVFLTHNWLLKTKLAFHNSLQLNKFKSNTVILVTGQEDGL